MNTESLCLERMLLQRIEFSGVAQSSHIFLILKFWPADQQKRHFPALLRLRFSG